MAAPSEKLARSLEALKKLQDRNVVAIRSSDLERLDRAGIRGVVLQRGKAWKYPDIIWHT